MNYFKRVEKRLDEATLENSDVSGEYNCILNNIKIITITDNNVKLYFNNIKIPICGNDTIIIKNLFNSKYNELSAKRTSFLLEGL